MKLITFSPHKIRTYNRSEKYKIATKKVKAKASASFYNAPKGAF